MAIFRLQINPIKRSDGHSAVEAAAYRAGERIHDERRGAYSDYSERQDVRHAEIFLPSRFSAAGLEWARTRSALWNAAEKAEVRSNARVAREFQAALPPELTHRQRLALSRAFAQELADRYGVAVDLAVHDPKPEHDPRNFHAHFLLTTREATAAGLGDKTGLELSGALRISRGLLSHSEEYVAVRERWAIATNAALQEANLAVRVDHRSLAAQGIARKPVVHVPMEFYKLEKLGVAREVAERLRSEYRARAAARSQRPDELAGPARVSEQQQTRAAARDAPVEPDRVESSSVEEIRQRAVQAWLRMRAREAEKSAGTVNDAGREAAGGNHGRSRVRAGDAEHRQATPPDLGLSSD